MRGRWVVLLVAAAAAAALAVALATHGGSAPKPAQLSPTRQVGDDADLMRRLERHKLVQRSK